MTGHCASSNIGLSTLAPVDLPSYRKTRYLGDDISISLNDLSPADQATLRALYRQLSELFTLLQPTLHAAHEPFAALQKMVEQPGWMQVIWNAQQLGKQGAVQPSKRLHQVLHDIRGGALQALMMHLQFIGLGITQPDDLPRIFFLTRDHLKIMRNAISDIDPVGSARDSEERLHGVDLLVEKWQGTSHPLPDQSAVVHVDCHYHGSVSERCVEFAALDRVIYNMVNNAVRYAADGAVYLHILPLPEPLPVHVRFVIVNAVDPSQRVALEQRSGADQSSLFEGGFTTGGTGVGMRICAEFVSNAYGVATIERAIREGYVGARLVDDRFVSWFHWPIVAD